MTDRIRSPICTVLGHVDHGKSKILDTIRGSNILAKEAGGITQAIGASIIPLETIKKNCEELIAKMNVQFSIPGLLFIDTPGHSAFVSLRKRGGSIADFAILVVDINEGMMPQTIEALEILKVSKTPFIIAANKVDLVSGWKSKIDCSLIDDITSQNERTTQLFETKMYEVVGKLAEHGIQAERFDRVTDFTKQIAIIPVSAMTGEGISFMLMTLIGLVQRYMEQNLHIMDETHAKGTILEVKEEKGLGKTIDVILYDGTLNKDDILVIGGIDGAIVTRVKMLLEPEPLAEMRDKKTKYVMCKSVNAATGVKIVAPDIDKVISGMPVRSCKSDEIEQVKEDVQQEVESALIHTDREGVVLRADTIGGLEALSNLLRDKKIPIMSANIGNVARKDVLDASSNFEKNPEFCVVLGFNVTDESGVINPNVKVITHQIIYKILDDLDYYLKNFKEEQEKRHLELMTYPAKFEILKGYVFRQNNPAVVGVHVTEGKIKAGMDILKEGKVIASIKSIGKDKETISVAEKNAEIAVAMDGVTVGRQIFEGDILYSAIKEEEYRRFKTLKKYLKEKEIEVIKEIAEQMRRENPLWGV